MYLNLSSKTIKIISGVLFLFISGNVQSAFIDNGLTTTDTLTNLEWLDLTETEPFSYNQIEIELQAGGLFDGYRRATMAELNTMFTNFGLFTGPVNATHLNFINLFGQTSDQNGNPESFGYAESGGDPMAYVYGLDFILASGVPSYLVYTGELIHSKSINFDGFGSFLVVKTVPLPAGIWLFVSGILGLIGISRKRLSKTT